MKKPQPFNPLIVDGSPSDTLLNARECIDFLAWTIPPDGSDPFEGSSACGLRLILQTVNNAIEVAAADQGSPPSARARA